MEKIDLQIILDNIETLTNGITSEERKSLGISSDILTRTRRDKRDLYRLKDEFIFGLLTFDFDEKCDRLLSGIKKSSIPTCLWFLIKNSLIEKSVGTFILVKDFERFYLPICRRMDELFIQKYDEFMKIVLVIIERIVNEEHKYNLERCISIAFHKYFETEMRPKLKVPFVAELDSFILKHSMCGLLESGIVLKNRKIEEFMRILDDYYTLIDADENTRNIWSLYLRTYARDLNLSLNRILDEVEKSIDREVDGNELFIIYCAFKTFSADIEHNYLQLKELILKNRHSTSAQFKIALELKNELKKW